MHKLALILAATLVLPVAAHAQTVREKVTVKPNAVATSTISGETCYDANGDLATCAKTETAVKDVMTAHGPVTKTAVSKATPCGFKRNGKVKTCVTKTKTVTPD